MKRNIEIKVRLSKDEMQRLNKAVKKTSFSREGYVRRLINGYQPQAAPPEEYFDLVKELRSVTGELRKFTDTIPLSNIESLAICSSLTKRLSRACDRLQTMFLPAEIN